MYIATYGCQMNVRDSEAVKGLLVAEGYQLTDDPEAADIVLFNTCSVRQHAEDRVWSQVGLVSRRRRQNPIIGILGCMAQSHKEKIFKRAPAVDIVCGPNEIDNIALYLEEAIRTKENVLAVSEKERRESIYHTGFYDKKDHAYIVISEGCDNYCTYCVVPYVRGRLRHRPEAEIMEEVKAAVGQGISRITLLGQNVNSYDSAGVHFVGLLKKVSAIKGLKSLTFLTCHPKDTTPELFEVMRDTPVIKKELHMPLQSGSDRILKAMNRGYTAEKYLELVDRYRSIVYNGNLSADIIVGFPGETDEDFEGTVELMKKACFDMAFIFKYSPRPNTGAALLPDDVPLEVKERRHGLLLNLQKELLKEDVKK